MPAVFASYRDAAERFIGFFTANIRNPNTRRAYARAAVKSLHGARLATSAISTISSLLI
jgi:hypothetical protein